MNGSAVFFGCFLFGLLFTAVSFVGGHLHFGHAGHLHTGTHRAHGGSRAVGHWFSPFSLAAFLCWFGGIGFLLEREHSMRLVSVLLFAVLAGCAGSAVISLFLTQVLLRNERSLRPEDTEMTGVLARVSTRVRAGGTGEIVFPLNGTRRCCAARYDQDCTLPRGTEVVVLRYSHGIAWVAPFHANEE